MKIFILVFVALVSMNSYAGVGAIFGPQDAFIFVQGRDVDATNLYESINVQPENDSHNSVKQVSVLTMNAEPIFDLICTKATLSGAVSCNIKVFSSRAVFDRDSKSVLMGINDKYEVQEIANLFFSDDTTYIGEVFQSIDKSLRIWKTFDINGNVMKLHI